jgi:hypothetical protein
MKKYVVSFLLFFSLCATAQKDPTRFNLTSELGIPGPVANKAMRKAMVGVYDFSVGINYRLYKGFLAGIVYKDVRFKIGQDKIYNVTTQMDLHAGGLRLGYDFVQEKGIFSVGFTAAYAYLGYSKLNTDSIRPASLQENVLLLEPSVQYYYRPTDKIALGFHLGTSYAGHTFDPYKNGLSNEANFRPSDAKGPLYYISFGFSLLYGFGPSTQSGELGGGSEDW